MKIKIFDKESFDFFDDFNIKKLESIQNLKIDMVGKKMGFFQDDQKIAILIGSICQYDQFVEKIIFYTTKHHQKNILFELSGDINIDDDQLRKIISIRNMSAVYKSPLKCEFSNQDRDSLFVSKQKPVDLKGIVNVFLLFSILNYYRLMVRHTKEFGSFFYNNVNLIVSQIVNKNLFVFLSLFFCFLFLVYQIQIWIFKKKLADKQAFIILIFVHTIYLSLSIYVALIFEIPFVLSGFMNLTTMILFLKGISYSHVLYDVRFYIKVLNKEIQYNKDELNKELSNFNREIIEKYKDDFTQFLTIKKFIYFILVPSLCYQLEFPRTKRIRKMFLFKRLLECIVIQIFQLFLLLEFWYPILQRSPEVFLNKPINKEYILNAIKYMIQLAGPQAASWLLFFFLFFHHIPNILSEILKFGDRHFYNDWWNCKNLGQYWRDWNLPVHNWFLRHIAFPLSYYGVPKFVSNIIIFFLSAVVHEYLFSLAIGQIRFYIFLSFFFQVFYMITEIYLLKLFKLQQSNWGNFMFWWNFCVIGQPILAVIYYLGRVQ